MGRARAKEEWRLRMRMLREALPRERHRLLSRLLCRRLDALLSLLGLRRVAVYAAVRGEADLSPLWEGNGRDRRFFFPRVSGEELNFHAVEHPGRDLRPGAFGIPEPGEDAPRPAPGALDAVLAPGLAFDRLGRRIGSGKGFYDRWAASLGEGPLWVGVGFAFQLEWEGFLPWRPGDRPMDWVVTDREAVCCLPCTYAPGEHDERDAMA